jgi:tetratricopeptide (TPR) repeat protein
MNEARLKYVFYSLSAFLLILMLFLSRNAGISCDEVLHYDHSVTVYNYFATHGQDKSALNTPVTNLKYYGQSYDDITTFIIKWFGIDDVYRFRHLTSSLAGWLTFFITALFAVWLSGYRSGIIVLFLFAVSPTFFGHTQNNLKDIPFALGYISSIFFTLKFIQEEKRFLLKNSVFLILSIAFTMSIRAAGLLLICYLFLFLLSAEILEYLRGQGTRRDFFRKLLLAGIITVAAWFLSIVIWPFALQSPIKNVMESYNVMAHFPSTFRQVFEGRVLWSDQMPWYYIPKSMIITIPVVVLTGLICFAALFRIKKNAENAFRHGVLMFTILFPLLFVMYEKSNVYSSWRQFLFLYPGIILLSASGYDWLFGKAGKKYIGFAITAVVILLSFHPLKFMAENPRYYYLYYNQFTGGLKGAYSHYETDYYYTAQTEASEWLIKYLNDNKIDGKLKVAATYSVSYQFRKNPGIGTFYMRFEERSLYDWDYAIITNRYIPLFQLKNNIWPPSDALYTIKADGVPICIVVKRRTKDDYKGYVDMNQGKNDEAISDFENALRIVNNDEMIFYNFAAALRNAGKFQKADSLLRRGLELNPDFEPILMYQGNIARFENRNDEALEYYGKVIAVNSKYFDAYVAAAELLVKEDVGKARDLLRKCLDISPHFKPAIEAMAKSYQDSDPGIAEKYYELLETLN